MSAVRGSGVSVREAAPADLERQVEFLNRFARPARWISIDVARRFEAANPEPNRCRLLAEDAAGAVVAVGTVSDGGMFAQADRTHLLDLRVAPEHLRKGLGSTLLERLETHARSKAAARLNVKVRSDEPAGLAFAERHGYREYHRRYESYLDVPTFDASRFEDPLSVAARAGVRIVPFRAVEEERVADRIAFQREVYDFISEAARDIPRPGPAFEPVPFEQVRALYFEGDDLLDRDCTVVALRDGAVVGATITSLRPQGVGYTNMTGVTRAERGKGLALAMKLVAIAALRAKGARLFGTTNDEANAPMRGINEKLGYRLDPPSVHYEKALA